MNENLDYNELNKNYNVQHLVKTKTTVNPIKD